MAYQEARRKTVVFGGSYAVWELEDTWEYGVLEPPVPCNAPCCPLGVGYCPTGLALNCATAPVIGGSFCLAFDNPAGPVGLNVLVVGPALVPAAALFSGICGGGFLHVLPVLVLSSTGNPASICIAVPDVPALVGQVLALQGGSYETGSCFRLTNAILARFQAR